MLCRLLGLDLFHCVGWQAGEDGDEPGGHRNYICPALQTGLCDWSAKYFAQPVMKVTSPTLASPVLEPTSLTVVCPSCVSLSFLCESHVRPFALLFAFVAVLSIGRASKSEHNKVLLVEFWL